MSNAYRQLQNETKAAAIRRLWNCSPLNREDIAQVLGVSLHYVRVVISQSNRPTYKAEWMRRKRKTDPHYYRRELEQQRLHYAARRKGGSE